MASPAPDLLAAVSPNEREFVVVWNVLAKLAAWPDLGLLPATARTAADLLLEIMRAADCLDPTTILVGSRPLSTA